MGLVEDLAQSLRRFYTAYDEHRGKQYGLFQPVVDEVVEEYLRCEDLYEACPEVSKEICQGVPRQPRPQGPVMLKAEGK